MERLYYVDNLDWKAPVYHFYDDDDITEYANMAWYYLFNKEDIINNIKNREICCFADGVDDSAESVRWQSYTFTKEELENYDFMMYKDDLENYNDEYALIDMLSDNYNCKFDEDFINDFMLKKDLKDDNELAKYIINFLEKNAEKINEKTWDIQFKEYDWDLDIALQNDSDGLCYAAEQADKETEEEFKTLNDIYFNEDVFGGCKILKSEKGNYFYRYYSNNESDARSYLNGAYIQINKENLNKVLNELNWNDSYEELSEDDLEVKKELIENIK